MPSLLPLVPSVGEYTFDAQLDSTTTVYQFRVRWNVRAAKWFLDVAALDGTPVASGLAIVLGAAIGSEHAHHPPFINGTLAAFDTSGQGRDAGFDDLGVRVIVAWFSRADLVRLYLDDSLNPPKMAIGV